MRLLLLLSVALCAIGAAIATSVPLGRRPHRFTAYEDMTAAERVSINKRSSIPLSGGVLTLGAYFANVQIGTPPQTYSVLLDTGSSNLAVASYSLQGAGFDATYDYTESGSTTAVPMPCDSKECQRCNLHGNPAECTFAQPFCWPEEPKYCGGSISYGGSSSFLRGVWVTDTVTFGGLTTNATSVMAINGLSSQWLAQSGLSGIIGLAHEWNAINPTYIPTLFNTLVEEKKVDNLFTLCLTPSSGGSLDLGYINASKYSGTLQYVNITKQRWYNMPLVDITFSGNSIGIPASEYWFDNDSIGSFIDSGTSTIITSPVIYQALVSLWQSKFCSLPSVCGSNTIFDGQCVDSYEGFPAMDFHFTGSDGSDVVLSTPASSYMVESQGKYCFSIGGLSGVGVVMGDSLLTNYFTVYDKGNARVGFAPVASGGC